MTVTTIADLLALLRREPGRPRVTWYGDDGERVELSGAVLENWVNKTTNLLVEEFDTGPGTRVLLDLPGHWRTVVWALATWRVGACVVLPGSPGSGGEDAHVVVTDRPADDAPAGAPVVAVALPALARTFPGGVPAGVTDAAAAVMTYGDALGWVPPLDAAAPALADGRAARGHGDLVPAAVAAADVPQGARTASAVPDDRVVLPLLDLVLAAFAVDGSVVLLSPATDKALRADEDRRARLLASERVTHLAG